MPRPDDRKPIRENYALDYYRRPWATRLWKARWNWTALGLSIVGAAVLFAWRRDRAFQAAPVNNVHAMFAADCGRCHDQRWQATVRLVTLDDHHHSVSDGACRQCHETFDHTAGMTPAPACAACHQEHRPGHPLTAVADSWCTGCHGDLTREALAGPHFHATIKHFGAGPNGHPEFALLRSDNPPGRAGRGLNSVAFPSADGSGHWLDKGGLKFNHKVHLDPEGVAVADGEREVLACAACHAPDANGAYMSPINYEQHCSRCHPLRMVGTLAPIGTLPHESPEAVRGVLRERLANLFASTRASTTRPEARDNRASPTRLPLLPKPITITDEEARRVDAALVRADHAVFGPEAKGYCRYCHQVEADGRSWRVSLTGPLVKTDPTTGDAQSAMVPDRWLPHGGFHHLKHRAVKCGSCHLAAESADTTDILLPSVDVCRQCHDPRPPGGNVIASSDCAFCHKYHGEGDLPAGLPLEELVARLAE